MITPAAGPIHTTAELARAAATWYDGFQPADPGDRVAAAFGWLGPEQLSLVLLPGFEQSIETIDPGLAVVLKAQGFRKVALCLDHWGYPPDVQDELRKVREAMQPYKNDLDLAMIMTTFAHQVGAPDDRSDRVKATTVIAIGSAPDDKPWVVGKIRSSDQPQVDGPYEGTRFIQMLVEFLAA